MQRIELSELDAERSRLLHLPWLTVTEAATAARRSRRTIETWITEGLPVQHVQAGKLTYRRIRTNDLLDRIRNTPDSTTRR